MGTPSTTNEMNAHGNALKNINNSTPELLGLGVASNSQIECEEIKFKSDNSTPSNLALTPSLNQSSYNSSSVPESTANQACLNTSLPHSQTQSSEDEDDCPVTPLPPEEFSDSHPPNRPNSLKFNPFTQKPHTNKT